MAIPITRGKQSGPQKVVLYGVEGIGKSTWAAQFPNPVFIDTESGTRNLDVARAPIPTSWQWLKQIVSELTKDTQGFQTMVLDTADWALRMAADAICAEKKIGGIEDLGYGKGYTFLAEEWGRFLDSLTQLSAKGVHVVLLAHAQCRKFDLPEETGSYDRWEMKLDKKSAALAKEWADCVFFANYKVFIVQDEKTKTNKGQGGKRMMYTTHHVCWDAKNRYDLPDELPLSFESVAHCFPAAGPPEPPAPPQEAAAQAEPPPVPPSTPPATDAAASVHAGLAQLMKFNGVTEKSLMAIIARNGYYPADTKLENLPTAFIEGKILKWWPKILKLIEEGELNHASNN